MLLQNVVFQRCFMLSLTDFKTDVDLKQFCTIRIGGKAKYLYEADNLDSLYQAYTVCKSHNIKYRIIGLGANLIFDDLGFNGAIIVNRANKIVKRNCSLYIDSGTTIGEIVNFCFKHGLSGLESLAGIPSTMGGAVINNLGANACEIGEFVNYVICLDSNGKTIKLNKKQCNFAYRNSLFKQGNFIILKVKLTLFYNEKEYIKQAISSNINKKITTQPLNQPSAGSVFKRGEIIPSLEIDKLGLKGLKIGGAMISTKHAGFIVNIGNATCNDVKKLIDNINTKIKNKLNTSLNLEIEFVEY